MSELQKETGGGMPEPGHAESFPDETHEPHVFLYVPDASMETGWSTHRVPERRQERASDRPPMGFHR